MRTPLNGVLGVAAVLRHKLPEDYAALLGQIETSGRELLDLFTGMLDMALAETGLLKVASESLHLDDLIAEAVEGIRPSAARKGLAIVVDGPPGGCRVLGDPERVLQVLATMLRNAVDFTPGGRIGVAVFSDSRAAPVRVTVTDAGPGVPARDREAIFARFRQVDGGETRAHGGTGTGLSLARDLVELMGGRIGVDAAPGGGAAFWFELARDPQDAFSAGTVAAGMGATAHQPAA